MINSKAILHNGFQTKYYKGNPMLAAMISLDKESMVVLFYNKEKNNYQIRHVPLVPVPEWRTPENLTVFEHSFIVSVISVFDFIERIGGLPVTYDRHSYGHIVSASYEVNHIDGRYVMFLREEAQFWRNLTPKQRRRVDNVISRRK